MPIEITETTSSKVMGTTSVAGSTKTTVHQIELMDLNPDWCSLQMQIPDSFTVTNINDQISEAMQQANEAMAQMDPEQQAMLESMGLGDMLSGMSGAAVSGVLRLQPAVPVRLWPQLQRRQPAVRTCRRPANCRVRA